MAQAQSNRLSGNGNYDHESSEELKRDVDRTRSAMDETIDALVERLDPSTLISNALSGLMRGRLGAARKGKHALGGASTALAEKIKENPIPAALIAAGVAWLMLGSDDDDDADIHQVESPSRTRAAMSSAKHRIASTAGKAGSRAGSAAASMRDGAASATHASGEALHSVGHSISHGAQRATSSVTHASQQSCAWAQETYSESMESYPLLVGAGAFGMGLLCGLAIPETRAEHQALGPYRDALKQQGQEAVQHAKQAAQKTVHEAQEKMKDEGIHPQQLVQTAKRVAEHVGEDISHHLEEEGASPGELKEKMKRTASHTAEAAKQETSQEADQLQRKAK